MLQLARMLSLVLLAALGTVILMRSAPGYFTDIRETDTRYAESARAELAVQRQEQSSIPRMGAAILGRWLHGDLGRSRQYDVPVTSLLGDRLRVTAKLLFGAVATGWMLAFAAVLPLAARRTSSGEALIAAPVALLLAIPTGALATLCLMLNSGGPFLVLATIVGVRDFKLLYRLFRESWAAPCVLHARAMGMRTSRITIVHLLPRVGRQLLALAMTSFVLALSAVVPVEVIFNVPGAGQLAWSAAMNRDLPMLLAITLILALCVGAASLAGDASQQAETA